MAHKAPSDMLRDIVSKAGLGLEDAKWSAMLGGRTNELWKLETPEKCVVAKLFNDQAVTPLFPNDGYAEFNALAALKGLNIAPIPIADFQTPRGLCILYDHIEGPTWSTDVASVAKLLSRLHSLNLDISMREVASGSDALRSQTETVLEGCNQQEASQLRSLMPTSFTAPTLAPRLLHGDVVSTNLINATNGIHLIDWQCPGLGDPCEDIAVFLSPAMQVLYGNKPLEKAQLQTFFKAYNQPEITTRYQELSQWFHWRMAAYCCWKGARGAKDYARAACLELEQLNQYQKH